MNADDTTAPTLDAERKWAARFLAEWARPYFGDDARDALAAVLRGADAAGPRPTAIAAERDRTAEVKAEALREAARRVQRIFDMQCPPRRAEDYVDRGAWMAHRWWNTVLGAELRRLRDDAERLGSAE